MRPCGWCCPFTPLCNINPFHFKPYLNLNVFTPPVGYGYIIVTETRIEISLKQSTPEAASYCSTIEMAHYDD